MSAHIHKIALIGAGRIGHIHARNAALHPRLELTAVVDPVAVPAQALAAQWNARVATLDEVLADPGIGGIIIASSTDTHLDYSLRAVQAGKVVFCEKPLDLDLERARSAADVLTDARLLVAFNRRFDPHFQALKACLVGGDIGTLESLHITSHDPAPPPPSYIAVSGGLFKDMAIHDFDMARWLLDEPIGEVWASGSCLVDAEIGRLNDVDTARTVLKTASGRLCVISNTRRSGYGYDQRIEAYASAGMVRTGNVHETTVEVLAGEHGGQRERLQNFFLDRYAEAYRREMAHFADMLDGARPAANYADGIAALALAEAAAHSARTGEVVRV